MFMEANDLLTLSDNRKRVFFLSYCGPHIFKMAKAILAPTNLHTVSWETLQKALETHYAPASLNLVRRDEFYRSYQREGETINDFVARIRMIAADSEFSNLEEMMEDRLVLGMEDLNLQKQLLSKPGIMFQVALDETRANPLTSRQQR